MMTLSDIPSACAEDVGPANIGDFNGDNLVDYLFVGLIGVEMGDSAEVHFGVVLNSLIKPFSNKKLSLLGYRFQNVGGYPVPADLDNDGALDVILGNSRVINVLINTDSTSGIKDKTGRPDFTLTQNYPNPFNGQTQIIYSVRSAGQVNINLYDILGRKVKTIVNEYQTLGTHEINFQAESMSTGIYFYELVINGNRIVRKMAYIK